MLTNSLPVHDHSTLGLAHTQAREDIFKMPRTEYPLLADITRSFEPTATLWRMAGQLSRNLPEWMDGPFPEIDAEAVSADVDK